MLLWQCSRGDAALSSGISGSLASTLASHLGVQPALLTAATHNTLPWSSFITIDRQLQGTGFHRTLHLRLRQAHPYAGDTAAADAAASPSDEGAEEHYHTLLGCALSLLQPLPPSIFADPYELQGITTSGGGSSSSSSSNDQAYTFTLLGPLDLEL
jgi:hypothetical protein